MADLRNPNLLRSYKELPDSMEYSPPRIKEVEETAPDKRPQEQKPATSFEEAVKIAEREENRPEATGVSLIEVVFSDITRPNRRKAACLMRFKTVVKMDLPSLL